MAAHTSMLGSLVLPKKATYKETTSKLAHKHPGTLELEVFDYKEHYTAVLTRRPMCSLKIPGYHLITEVAKYAAACARYKYGLSELGLEPGPKPLVQTSHQTHKWHESSVAKPSESLRQ
ncbi:hypothetical protein FRC09_002771 [Ceratobasidium sp. 395]|nr:hypothetical protein FRC09_002771 [Ceratobasidium sp. 395]